MADADFVEQREAAAEESKVGEIEVVAGVEADAAAERFGGGFYEWSDGRFRVFGIEVGIRLRVELHAVGADACGFAEPGRPR